MHRALNLRRLPICATAAAQAAPVTRHRSATEYTSNVSGLEEQNGAGDRRY